MGIRERNRRAVEREIADAAMRLFVAQGFDATTTDQIAREAGVSPRSLFRYVGSKEDIVLGDMLAAGQSVLAALRDRPAGEEPWEALRAALHVLEDNPPERALAITEMFLNTPSLRARRLEKRLAWLDLLVPEVTRRLGREPGDVPDPAAHAIVSAALACLDTAAEIWARRGGTGDVGAIFDEAVDAVRHA
ncbi:AcrR family transcriptional regulator [Catenuloplanes nepalensis]|uniref:AcrR family transcriptional regulator n=1 Tax=Catenuloplanes nepalensis TaxID=587533 RepID=A0ABT9MRK3_9ACTN|nr:TetR family transcriptional regulator [Catenuloplanes nepalensis]MDP9793656.1 AcrR family transcriptional regulator [Catenuloplanes nepalensis]